MSRDRIDNRDTVISMRDVLARIEGLQDTYPPADDDPDQDRLFAPVRTWDDRDDRAEWTRLRVLVDEVSRAMSDDPEGVTLVREPEWVDYCRSWHEDTYGMQYGRYDGQQCQWVELSWGDLMSETLYRFVDWQAVADDMRRNCSEVMWEGFTYIIG